MIITLEDGTRYEIDEEGREYRVGNDTEWHSLYSIDAHPIKYSERKLREKHVGYSEPKPGLYLAMLTTRADGDPESPIATVVRND